MLCVLAFRQLRPSFFAQVSFKSSYISNDVVILSACRTPFGSFRKSLNPCTAPYLGSVAIRSAVERAGIEPKAVDECIMGNVIQAGLGQAPARQAALYGGLESSTVCTTLNKVCASGMKSIMMAALSISCGYNNIICAGGMESMSNSPFYLPRSDPKYGGITLVDSILHDGLTDAFNNIHMGICAERTAAKYKISREDQDNYAKKSYQRSQAAAKAGLFEIEVVPVQLPSKPKSQSVSITTDEEYNNVDFSKFPSLRTAFLPADKGGTVTAANSSTLNDGAAAAIVASERLANNLGLKPLARIVGFSDAAVDPVDFPVSPTVAINKLLKSTGISKDRIKIWEINEAFSLVALVNTKLLELDPASVNASGGSVSLGHPLGASGARITNHLALQLRRGEYGVASICNGGGGSSAIMLEGLL